VVIADIALPAATKLAQELNASACTAEALPVDVTDPKSVDALVETVVKTHGRIDYMFNNAGIAVGGEFQDVSAEAMRRVIEINLLGAAYGTLAAYRQMLTQHDGHIVNIGSMWSLMPCPMSVAYVAAKHGLSGLTASLRSEADAHGIHLTLICPGFISTNLFVAGTYGGGLDAEQAVARIPFKFIDVNTAVHETLKAVLAKKATAAFPGYVRGMWLLHRISPRLLGWLTTRMMQDQRKRFGSTAP
jgi:short-subunit dehydrogenase